MTIAAAAVGVGAMQGLAQAASAPTPGDAGVAAGKTVIDFLDAVRSGKHSTDSTTGAAY